MIVDCQTSETKNSVRHSGQTFFHETVTRFFLVTETDQRKIWVADLKSLNTFSGNLLLEK